MGGNWNSRAVAILLLTLALAVGHAPAAAPDLAKAEELLRANRAAEAYDLLEPFEFEEAGNLKYDYLLGVAALNSGKPDKATLVFERVLALEPRYLGVRLDLGRAYFQIGDLARATQESCQACYVRIRPHVLSQVMAGEQIITCDSCNRILYWKPDAPYEVTS